MDRVNFKNLLETVLDDDLVFSVHMHYNLHETVLGECLRLLRTLSDVHFSTFFFDNLRTYNKKFTT